eukprot:3051205-Amphidinium_carterae.1
MSVLCLYTCLRNTRTPSTTVATIPWWLRHPEPKMDSKTEVTTQVEQLCCWPSLSSLRCPWKGCH